MKQNRYNFSIFFASLCAKQGIDPSTKKETCLSWMESSLNKLSGGALKRLAQEAPERLDIQMYQLPSISQLLDLHKTLDSEEPLEQKDICPICKNMRWIIVINIDTGKESAALCQCMLFHNKWNSAFAKDLINTGRYVTKEDYISTQSLSSEKEEAAKIFLKKNLKI